MVIDHLCRVTNCVNPDHLEVVTRRENIIRGSHVHRHLKPSSSMSLDEYRLYVRTKRYQHGALTSKLSRYGLVWHIRFTVDGARPRFRVGIFADESSASLAAQPIREKINSHRNCPDTVQCNK
jgi:hypothetical protein